MDARDDIEALVADLRRKVHSLPLADGIVESHEDVEAWLRGLDDVTELRRAMLRLAKAKGWTNNDLAALLDVSRQRISQVIGQAPRGKTHTQGGKAQT